MKAVIRKPCQYGKNCRSINSSNGCRFFHVDKHIFAGVKDDSVPSEEWDSRLQKLKTAIRQYHKEGCGWDEVLRARDAFLPCSRGQVCVFFSRGTMRIFGYSHDHELICSALHTNGQISSSREYGLSGDVLLEEDRRNAEHELHQLLYRGKSKLLGRHIKEGFIDELASIIRDYCVIEDANVYPNVACLNRARFETNPQCIVCQWKIVEPLSSFLLTHPWWQDSYLHETCLLPFGVSYPENPEMGEYIKGDIRIFGGEVADEYGHRLERYNKDKHGGN